MMKRSIAFLFLAFALGSASAAEPLPGNLVLLPVCPGDKPVQSTTDREALPAAMLTPILTGALNQGIKAFGAHLQAAAREAEVDSVHAGGYFFEGTGESATDHIRCIIVANRAKRSTTTPIETLTAGYRWANYKPNKLGAPILSDGGDGSTQLAEVLKSLGYTERMPAFLSVIDVETNPKTRTGRFVPRYVFLDHSLREKGSSSPRDIKLIVTMTSPEADKAITSNALVFSEIAPGQSRVRNLSAPDTGALRVTGHWFGLPEASKPIAARATARDALDEANALEQHTANLAREAATQLGAQLPPECPTMEVAEQRLAIVSGNLVVENAKKEAARDARLVAKLTQSGNYYQSCMKIGIAKGKLDKLYFKAGEQFLPVDFVVTEYEYRHRPVAKFFGDLFSDKDVASGVTTALVNEYDPATRRATAEKDAAAEATVLSSYEDALLAAHKAELAYAAAKDADRAGALLDLEFKQRAANRLADRLETDRPFPAAGVRP